MVLSVRKAISKPINSYMNLYFWQNLKSIPWRLAEFYYNRGLQRQYTSTCTLPQETINGFICPLIVSLESEIHQLNFEGRD